MQDIQQYFYQFIGSYFRFLRKIMLYLENQGYYQASRYLIAPLSEPISCIEEALRLAKGLFQQRPIMIGMENFRIEKNHADRPTVVFLHGNGQSPSVFKPYLELLRRKGFRGPVMAPSLPEYPPKIDPDYPISKQERTLLKAIQDKIRDEYAKWRQTPKIVYFCISKGCQTIPLIATDATTVTTKRKQLHLPPCKILPEVLGAILIGHPLLRHQRKAIHGAEKIYEVIGSHDIMVTDRSFAPVQKTFKVGHLGLCQKPRIIKLTTEWLLDLLSSNDAFE